MKQLLAFSLAVLLAPAVAKADFLVDSFTTAGTPSSSPQNINGGSRVLSGIAVVRNPSSVGFASPPTPTGSQTNGYLQLTGQFSSLDPSEPPIAAAGQVQYTYALSFNPNANYLVLRDVTAQVPIAFQASIRTSFGTQSLTSTPVQLAAGNNGDIYLDITGLSNIQTTDRITLTAVGEQPTNFRVGQLEFASVPEPASLALAGFAVTSLGGVGFARRRRKVAAEAAV